MQKTDVMTADEEYEVACKAFEGDEEARNKLVKANLRFVFTVAKMYSHDPEGFNDLVAAGNIGLIDSAKKFDPHKGFKFISYAVWHIRKEMIEHLAKNSRTIRIPGNRNSIAVKAKEAQSVIYTKEGRDATEEEMLDYIKTHLKNTEHLTVRDMVDIFSADKKAWSLDQPLSEHGESESTLLDVYDGTVGSEQSVYDQDNFKHIVKILMADLTTRETEVVERIHAINDRMFPHTFTEVAESWGITPEAARVVYRKAVKKMQIKARKLKINISSIF
jgi:RNA polymerase primary sigma factor